MDCEWGGFLQDEQVFVDVEYLNIRGHLRLDSVVGDVGDDHASEGLFMEIWQATVDAQSPFREGARPSFGWHMGAEGSKTGL